MGNMRLYNYRRVVGDGADIILLIYLSQKSLSLRVEGYTQNLQQCIPFVKH